MSRLEIHRAALRALAPSFDDEEYERHLAGNLPGQSPIIPNYLGATPFEGGNQSHGSILEFVRYIAEAGDSENVAPTAGGTLTINSQSLGSYDYTIKVGNQTISSFSNTDWFTTTADSRSAIIVIKGDLTINSGQTLIPSNRKLFVTVYVTGNLVINGGVSMTARGANHSATGSDITANAIRIATGTFSSVTNPQVPAAGANGGAARTSTGTGTSTQAGNNGANGTDGATGGGGSGGLRKYTSNNVTVNSGAGAQGSGFGGGPGGGGVQRSTAGSAESGVASGGKGGDGSLFANSGSDPLAVGGGAGNPGGTKAANNPGTADASDGGDGTGGVLFVIVEGNYSGSGSITAAGANGGDSDRVGGAGSGGGSVTAMVGGTDTGPTPTALGGSGGVGAVSGTDASGGNGGNGTARKLAL